jgi:hypothetical protein
MTVVIPAATEEEVVAVTLLEAIIARARRIARR